MEILDHRMDRLEGRDVVRTDEQRQPIEKPSRPRPPRVRVDARPIDIQSDRCYSIGGSGRAPQPATLDPDRWITRPVTMQGERELRVQRAVKLHRRGFHRHRREPMAASADQPGHTPIGQNLAAGLTLRAVGDLVALVGHPPQIRSAPGAGVSVTTMDHESIIDLRR